VGLSGLLGASVTEGEGIADESPAESDESASPESLLFGTGDDDEVDVPVIPVELEVHDLEPDEVEQHDE
jgi:hypothetical protein